MECFQGYTIVKGKCEQRDDLCANFSQIQNKCLSCYAGYNLNSESKCVVTPIGTTGIEDINCIKIQGKECIKCADGYYLNPQKKCQQANPQCRSISVDGKCTSCYQGFDLKAGDCIIPSIQLVLPFCETYASNGECSKCLDRYYLQNGSCKDVSILCGNYDMGTGDCLSCTSPFFNLQKGKCIQLNSIIEGCTRYEGPFCVECTKEYYAYAYTCMRIDPFCVKFDEARRECQQCSGGKKPAGPDCR